MIAIVLALALSTPTAQSATAPPGLVLFEGGRATIGAQAEEIEELLLAGAPASLAGETPQHRTEVEDFFLMTTEVTNEQYAEYVRATGAKPPYYWGQKALDEGRRGFLEEQGKAAKEAREKGETFERKSFDNAAWWDDHWQESDWEVPNDLLAHPVTYIDYASATDYARWAGLRLMTENEFQYAARGEGEDPYPWGASWVQNAGAAKTKDMNSDKTFPVGSFPLGARNGVYDLIGGVWEWTSSPFEKYKGYRPLEVRKSKREKPIKGVATFDPNKRVTVGGSFRNSPAACRVTTRRDAERTQSADALGFRCAASVGAGLDAAQAILERDVRMRVLPEDFEFYPEGTVVTRNWKSATGTAASVKQFTGDGTREGEIENYAVIQGYEHVLFVPAIKVNEGSAKDLASASEASGPVFLGLLSTMVPLAEPALEPGNYLVSWRGEAKLEDGLTAPDDKTPFWEAAGFDAEANQFVFYDLEASAIAAAPSDGMLYDRMKPKGSIEIEPFVPPTEEELAKLEKRGEEPPTPLDTIRFRLAVAGKARSKGFLFDLALKVVPERAPNADWSAN